MQRNNLHKVASTYYKDPEEGLNELRKAKTRNEFIYKFESVETDHEGNMPIHLAMHFGNWQIAQYLLDNHPKPEGEDEDSFHPNVKDVDRFGPL